MDVDDYGRELQAAGRLAGNYVVTDKLDGTELSMAAQLGDLELRYQALVASSSDMLSKLDCAVECCREYDGLVDEVDQTLADVESVVTQFTVADTDSDVQHQLDLVTTAAGRLAAAGKMVSDCDRVSMSTVEALRDLRLTDSSRVHSIEQNLNNINARFTTAQQHISDHQRLVNAAYAELQDPSHNLAVLLNWVCCHRHNTLLVL